MAETTGIEWCDATFNPWMGCTRVSPACDDCYAARSTPARTLGVTWGAGQPRRRTSAGNWAAPKSWAKTMPDLLGRRPRVFCASLADVFDNEAPEEWRADLFALIHDTPELDWLLLTKRVGNAERMMRDALGSRWRDLGGLPLPNVWLGATVVTQEEADRDIPKLLQVPARVRFLSIEPMLEPINLRALRTRFHDPILNASVARTVDGLAGLDGWKVDWVICGGESGPKARPMHPDWARSLRDQCQAAGVPFLFKQWGEWLPSEAEDQPVYRGEHLFLGGRAHAFRVGKKAAGRVLDGMTHDGWPA